MSIAVNCILNTLIKIYDGFCFMIGFPYEFIILVKQLPGAEQSQSLEAKGKVKINVFLSESWHFPPLSSAVSAYVVVNVDR